MQSIKHFLRPQLVIPIIGSLISAGVLTYVAMRSSGFDWFISEIQAEVHYSALRHFHELPLFSYFLNGGSYLFQDPQNTLFTPNTIFILLFGPHAGIRWAVGLWGIIGFAGMYRWLKPKLGIYAAALAGLAWTLNLAMFWRLVVGNDMFMWNLGLPWFLLLIEKLVKESSWKYAVYLGLLSGGYLLGPSFHALVYLIFPVTVIWFGWQCVTYRPIIVKTLAQLGLKSLLAILIAMCIAAPKLYAFSQFSFDRTICPDGTIMPMDAWNSLFNQTAVLDGFRLLPAINGSDCVVYSYGTWESNIALFPVVYFLIFIAVVGLYQQKQLRGLGLWGVIVMILGWSLATTPQLWALIQQHSGDSLRVSARYLVLFNFIFSMFVGVGFYYVIRHLTQRSQLVVYIIFTSLLFVQVATWLNSASSIPSVYHGLTQPILAGSGVLTDHQLASTVHDYLLQYDRYAQYAISSGQVLLNGYFISGNDTPASDISINIAQFEHLFPTTATGRILTAPLSPDLSGDRLQLTHRRLTILRLQPDETITIYLQPGQLGQTITITPQLPIQLDTTDFSMTITNTSDQMIEELVIQPNSPVPLWLWISWIAGILLSSVSGIAYLWYNHRHAAHR